MLLIRIEDDLSRNTHIGKTEILDTLEGQHDKEYDMEIYDASVDLQLIRIEYDLVQLMYERTDRFVMPLKKTMRRRKI